MKFLFIFILLVLLYGCSYYDTRTQYKCQEIKCEYSPELEIIGKEISVRTIILKDVWITKKALIMMQKYNCKLNCTTWVRIEGVKK